MDIEQSFAAAVANARGNAKIANTAGFPQRVCDQVAGALADLWEHGRGAGLSGDDIQAIVDRYVEWDDQDEAWPREMPGNVVPLRR
jgi:hypothetical protein